MSAGNNQGQQVPILVLKEGTTDWSVVILVIDSKHILGLSILPFPFCAHNLITAGLMAKESRFTSDLKY